jgi:putative tricarboxylic transport membrane protein
MNVTDKLFHAASAGGRRGKAGLVAVVAALVALMGGMISSSFAKESSWQPSRSVEFIVPSTAGGSLDLTARSLTRLWQKHHLLKAPIVVVNKPGGGHAVALSYLNQHRGDGNYIGVESPNLLLSNIVGRSTVTYTGVTPICMLFTDYMAFAVKSDSPIKSGKDLVSRLKKAPGSLSIALSSAVGGTHYLALTLALRAGGVDLKKLKLVAFQSNSKAITALLGGHVDVMVGAPSAVMPYMDGKLRIIAVSSPQRLPGALSGIPTWKEQGYDAVFANWRAIVAPKGISDDEREFWQNVCKESVQLDEFKKMLAPHLWVPNYMGSAETEKFMKNQYDLLQGLLVEVGLAAKK